MDAWKSRIYSNQKTRKLKPYGEGKNMHLFRSPVTRTDTPGLLSASYLARWSTMAAPSLRWSSLTWSRCVFNNTTLRMSPCLSCFPSAAVDGRRWKSAKVARRGVPAPGKREPGLKGSRESQKVSVSSKVNAALFCDAWRMSQVGSCARGRTECVLLRGEWDGRAGQHHSPPVEDRIELAC
jgi:hypothetical protein